MSTVSTLYTNARIIDPATSTDLMGELLVSNDTIVGFAKTMKAPKKTEVVDCGQRILCPGFVDMRAHDSDDASATAGGITSIALQADQKTIIDTDLEVERIRQKTSRNSDIHVYPMAAATRAMQGSDITEIGSMLAAGAVGFSDCNSSPANTLILKRLMEYCSYFDALLVTFAEDKSLAADGYAHEGATATRLGLAGIPVEAEVLMIERDAMIARMTGARVHIALVSSAAGVQAIKEAKTLGTKITASVAPHYLHLNDNALEGYRTFAKVSPPFRSEEDRLALIAGLADGTIDCIVSDHKPQSEDVKRLPFAQAADGVVSFETMLALTLSMVHAGKVELMTALKALTSTPAKLLGIEAGALAKGMPADITIFDPSQPWVIEEKTLKSKEKNTPFDTLPVQGKVWRTIVAGRTVFKQ